MDTVQSAAPLSAEVESGGGLRRNAVGLTGAVIMSAAIMGPAVSTFFNPQFSMPVLGRGDAVRLSRCAPGGDADHRQRHHGDGA